MSTIDRRAFVRGLAGSAALGGAAWAAGDQPGRRRPNVLMITADDLNWDSLGATGCRAPDVTPNLDRLASEGIWFKHGHVTIAVCQPCRSVWMTGRYPHRNGATGFNAIDRDVPTLQESLRAAGYMNGIMAKVVHLAPIEKFCWDTVVKPNELGVGRNPARFYRHAKAFFESAKEAGRPFFLMANTQDPHRPFAGSQQERQSAKKGKTKFPGVRRTYRSHEIEVPGFLPDIPLVRREVAEYFTSVHRCDEMVGEVLRALRETGFEDETIVMFLGDHGMAFPFAKTNCYLNSTRTPWLVRWPGVVRPGTVDTRHFVSGIDFMPTILDACGLEAVEAMDGRSFLPLLRGERQAGRDRVYTVFHETFAKHEYPMRCLQDSRWAYLFNPWSDGETVFRNESQSGLSFKAMQAAAQTNKEIAARVKLFQYRVPEEFYNVENDPNQLVNLIDKPKYKAELDSMRQAMLETMKKCEDPLLPEFQKLLAKSGAE